MKTSQILLPGIALIAALVVIGCSQPITPDTTSTTQVQQPLVSLFNPVYASNNYVEYTPAALTKAQEEWKKTSVFFHSKTCSSCAKLDADFEMNEVILPEDVVVFKADWDENQDLAGQLNVAKYHTIAYMNDDWTSTNTSGLFTVEEVVQEWIENEVVLSPNDQYRMYDSVDVAMVQKEWKDVALFFHSKTCSSCAKLDKAISTDTDDLPENMVVFKTDWDDNQELAQEYNVSTYHTVAIMQEDWTTKNFWGLFTVWDLIAANSIQ